VTAADEFDRADEAVAPVEDGLEGVGFTLLCVGKQFTHD